MKKQMYHSELRELSPIQVTVLSDQKQSKYSKPNDPKPDYFELKINGEVRNYNLENPKCANVFKGMRGQTFTVQAEGTREDAVIFMIGDAPKREAHTAASESASRTDHHLQNHQSTAQQQSQPGEKKIDSLLHCRQFAGRRLSLFKVATKAMLSFKKEFDALPAADRHGITFDGEIFWSKVTTLYISLQDLWREGFPDKMPINISLATLEQVKAAPKSAAPAPELQKPPTPPPPPSCQKCGKVLDEHGLCSTCDNDIPF